MQQMVSAQANVIMNRWSSMYFNLSRVVIMIPSRGGHRLTCTTSWQQSNGLMRSIYCARMCRYSVLIFTFDVHVPSRAFSEPKLQVTNVGQRVSEVVLAIRSAGRLHIQLVSIQYVDECPLPFFSVEFGLYTTFCAAFKMFAGKRSLYINALHRESQTAPECMQLYVLICNNSNLGDSRAEF